MPSTTCTRERKRRACDEERKQMLFLPCTDEQSPTFICPAGKEKRKEKSCCSPDTNSDAGSKSVRCKLLDLCDKSGISEKALTEKFAVASDLQQIRRKQCRHDLINPWHKKMILSWGSFVNLPAPRHPTSSFIGGIIFNHTTNKRNASAEQVFSLLRVHHLLRCSS